MKIYIYDQWKNSAGTSKLSYKPIGHAVIIQGVDIESINYNKINAKLAKLPGSSSGKLANYLVIIGDLDYQNATIGTKNECGDFIRTCLKDIKFRQ